MRGGRTGDTVRDVVDQDPTRQRRRGLCAAGAFGELVVPDQRDVVDDALILCRSFSCLYDLGLIDRLVGQDSERGVGGWHRRGLGGLVRVRMRPEWIVLCVEACAVRSCCVPVAVCHGIGHIGFTGRRP